MDKDKFINLLAAIAELYKQELSKFLIDMYYNIFKEYPYEQFEGAVREVIKNNKYNCFPKPAEILEYLEGSRDDKALGGWLRVLEAVQKGGYYASIEFADAIIPHCVNELGGWHWFCSLDKEQLPFIEKRFCDLYRLFLKRGVSGNPRLIGFIEARNNKSGYSNYIPESVRIGFDDKNSLKITDGQ